nr:immunoglobulin light chain junction region [Macaca mulatta]
CAALDDSLSGYIF